MAKSSKKLTKKAKQLIRSDVVLALAAVSLLLNLVTASAWLTVTASNNLDLSIYRASEQQLCYDNYVENITDEIDSSTNPDLAAALFEVTCHSGEFERYHDNAVQAYLNDVL